MGVEIVKVIQVTRSLACKPRCPEWTHSRFLGSSGIIYNQAGRPFQRPFTLQSFLKKWKYALKEKMLKFPTTWGLLKYHADSTSTKPPYVAKNDVIDQ